MILSPDADPRAASRDARAAADNFLRILVQLRALHDTDIAAADQGDPSAKSIDEVIACYPALPPCCATGLRIRSTGWAPQ